MTQAKPSGSIPAFWQRPAETRRRLFPGVVLATPIILLMTLCLLIPLWLMLSYSFYRFIGGARFEETFTLANYASVLMDSYYLSILWNTLLLGFLVTAVTLVLGYPVALAIVRTSGLAGSVITALVVLPLATSVIVRTYGWLVLLGSNGLVNRGLVAVGLVDSPVHFLFDQKGIIIGLVHIFLPFMILAVASSLRNVDMALEDAARNLGASPLKAFWRVTLPLTIPGMTTGCLLVFVLTISAFITPSIMGGLRVKVMAMVVYEQAMAVSNWPLASALSVVLLIVTLALIGGSLRLSRWSSRWQDEVR